MAAYRWSDVERWAWGEIRAGRVADLNAREGRRDGLLDPKTPAGWDGRRKLSPGFLKEILFRGPYRGAIPVEGVRVVGAWLPEPVDLSHGHLDRQLWLERCRFEAAADLAGLRVDGWLSLEGSAFVARGTVAAAVDLAAAEVGGSLTLGGATVAGKLGMSGLTVGRGLFMGAGATFQAVDLTGAEVGGQLALNGATVAGELVMNDLAVERSLFMREATLTGRVSLIFARIGANLDLSGSELTELDLSGTRITGELHLGSARHPRTRWPKGAGSRLNLTNAHAGALQDRRDRVTRPWWRRLWRWLLGDRKRWEDAWPDELQLDGFTYGRLGGFGAADAAGDTAGKGVDSDMLARDIGWYIGWLARDRSYAPQPYEQLAAVFRAAGEPTKANRVLYASRERERKEALAHGNIPRWTGLSLLKLTIGYGLGLGYFWALAWVVVFTAIGAAVLYFSGQPSQGLAAGLPARVVYSLDQLLPIVEFERYDEVVLTGGVAYYFYGQKLVGWLLGSFLVAGLAGLTQK